MSVVLYGSVSGVFVDAQRFDLISQPELQLVKSSTVLDVYAEHQATGSSD